MDPGLSEPFASSQWRTVQDTIRPADDAILPQDAIVCRQPVWQVPELPCKLTGRANVFVIIDRVHA